MSIVRGAREIGVSKFAEKFNRFSVVGPRCVDFIYEVSNENVDPIEFDLCVPLSFVGDPTYPFIARFIVLLRSTIHHVFLMSCRAQIFISIIKMVTIDMVWLHPFRAWAYYFVHREKTTTSPANSNEAIARFASAPIKLGQFSMPVCADSGVQTFCNSNEFDRLVKRLLDSVAFFSVGFHSLSATEIMRWATALSSFNYNTLEAV